jgi:hypothetical protein
MIIGHRSLASYQFVILQENSASLRLYVEIQVNLIDAKFQHRDAEMQS